MNAEKRFEIFKRLSIAIPQPTTELEHSSTFELEFDMAQRQMDSFIEYNKS